jgi:sulfur-carrier protein
MKILYFAKLRQAMGRNSEELEIPGNVQTICELIDFLSSRDERAAHAFSDLRTIKAAINQSHVPHEARIEGATEIAFFPPVTGG